MLGTTATDAVTNFAKEDNENEESDDGESSDDDDGELPVNSDEDVRSKHKKQTLTFLFRELVRGLIFCRQGNKGLLSASANCHCYFCP